MKKWLGVGVVASLIASAYIYVSIAAERAAHIDDDWFKDIW